MPESTNIDGEMIGKNPVWIFPTESTNFLRIESDVDSMIGSIDKISTVPTDSSAYHTGMLRITSYNVCYTKLLRFTFFNFRRKTF